MKAPPAPSSPVTRPPRSGLVDAWRALACLGVVLFHGTESATNSGVHPLIETVAGVGRHGWLGVPVFFVISGYCLSQAIERRSARHAGSVAFWQDRLLRIYPVYWSAFAFACLLALAATPFNGLPAASAFPSSPTAWLADLGLFTAWLNLPPHLTVSWTLDHEIGFYLLVGFALLLPSASPVRRLCLHAVITALALVPVVGTWFPPLAFWPQFACGIAVHATLNAALPAVARALAGLSLAALAGFCLAFDGFVSAFAPLAALVLLATLAAESFLPRPPRVLVAVGLASYSIYLVHIPLMSPALNLARRVLGVSGPGFACAWLGHLALGVVGGLVFHRLVEKRCERLRARLASR